MTCAVVAWIHPRAVYIGAMDSRAQALEKLKKKRQEKAAAAAKASVVDITSEQEDALLERMENPVNEPPPEMTTHLASEVQKHILLSSEMLGVKTHTSPSKVEFGQPKQQITVEEDKSEDDDDRIFDQYDSDVEKEFEDLVAG